MTEDNLQIVHSEAENRGRFSIERDGKLLAELTYSRANAGLVIIDHTMVMPQLEGKGVARRLLDAAVAWARETSTKVMATCSYASVQFARDPSIRDVLRP
jgi:predicted GNAT family acetyltransferase